MRRVNAFLDTNYFLHYRALDQVPWLKVFAADAVELLIAPVVIRELNDKKDIHPTTKLRDRAASTIARLDQLAANGLEVSLGTGVLLRFLTEEPRIDFSSNHLSPSCQDDVLVATALDYQATKGESVALFTADVGLKLKCIAKSIRVYAPPDDLKLPEIPDPRDRKIRELEDEIRTLKRATPQLEMLFSNETNRERYTLHRRAHALPKEIMSIEEIKSAYPLRPIETLSRNVAHMLTKEAATMILPEDAKEYNERLERFFEAYEDYRGNYLQFLERHDLRITLDLILVNSGTSPADDIDITLHFPDGFELFEPDNLPAPPEVPEPPSPPRSALDKMLGPLTNYAIPIMPKLELPNLGIRRGLQIRRTNSYEVTRSYSGLKHNRQYNLEGMIAQFDSFENAKSFKIDYFIHAANIPQEVTGALHVIVETDRTK